MEWEKIIKESEEGRYVEKLSEIAEVILKETRNLDVSRIDIMGGRAGIALFLFYYAKYTREEKYYDFGMDLLNDIFDTINEGSLFHTFAGGLAGIGWTIEHLVKNEFIDADSDEILRDLDPFLKKMMISEIKKKNYDYLHGALGIGLYFLSRTGNKQAKDYLVELIDWLDKISMKDKSKGLKWKSLLNRDENLEGFNLSLSHGISSIIVLLSKMFERGIHKDKVSTLLEGAMRFLFHHSLDTKKYLSFFPSWVASGHPPARSRLAWCYGDLGNTIAIWQAARSTGNKTWEEKAVDIIVHSTRRRDIKENMVLDAGLCHGGAGIANIFNRMYHYTKIDACKETAIYWFDQTLKMATHKGGYAGFKIWRSEEYGGWINDAGLLEGIAGIGLALLSLVSDIEPRWDGALLIS